MAFFKVKSGFNNKTKEHLLIGVGAFFKNFEVGTDTYESAVSGGKLLGATQGGGKFKAVPATRNITIDGVNGEAKGMRVLDYWTVEMEANVLEISIDNLKLALFGLSEDKESVENYVKLKASNYIKETDYLKNITYIGQLTNGKEIILQIENAIHIEGLELEPKNNGEGIIKFKFVGTYDSSNLDEPPFAIYYPAE